MAKKVAVVTGSAKGLGKAIVLALADKGYTVVVHYRKSKSEAEEVLAQVRNKSPKSILVAGDLCDENMVDRIFAEIFGKLGRVDVLVNNVGDYLYREFA